MGKIKNNIQIIILLFYFFSLLIGCAQPTEPDDPIEEEVSNGILPLKVGYYWKYKNYYLREDSSVAGVGIDEEYIINKSSSILIDNKNYVVFHRIWGYLDPNIEDYRFGSDEWLYRNFYDGLYLMGGKLPSDSIFTNLIQYKYPVRKGEIWKSPHLVYDLIENKYMISDSIIFSCTDTNAIFETPSGNFSCTVYNHKENQDPDVSEKLNIYEYYAVNVGLIGIIYKGYFNNPDSSYLKSKKVLVQTNVQQ